MVLYIPPSIKWKVPQIAIIAISRMKKGRRCLACGSDCDLQKIAIVKAIIVIVKTLSVIFVFKCGTPSIIGYTVPGPKSTYNPRPLVRRIKPPNRQVSTKPGFPCSWRKARRTKTINFTIGEIYSQPRRKPIYAGWLQLGPGGFTISGACPPIEFRPSRRTKQVQTEFLASRFHPKIIFSPQIVLSKIASLQAPLCAILRSSSLP